MHRNQSVVIGPKIRPTPAVPLRCTKKRAVMIAIAIGTTQRVKIGVATWSPSTAPSTEMAGVITPSP